MSAAIVEDTATRAFKLVVGYARDCACSLADAVMAGAGLKWHDFKRLCELVRKETWGLLRMENYWRSAVDGDEAEQYRCARRALQDCMKEIHAMRNKWVAAGNTIIR